jgi:hemerythrin
MPLIQWQDSFSVGVASVDADHQVLVGLLNQLYEAREEGQTRDVVGSVVNVLIEYTVNHFQREEKLMELGGYPEIEVHKDLHRKLTAQVLSFQQQFAGGRNAAVDELFEFLKNWLIGHILMVDTRYRPWVEKVELDARDLGGLLGQPMPDDE